MNHVIGALSLFPFTTGKFRIDSVTSILVTLQNSSSFNLDYSFIFLVFYISNAMNLAIYIINLTVYIFLETISHNFATRRWINVHMRSHAYTHTPQSNLHQTLIYVVSKLSFTFNVNTDIKTSEHHNEMPLHTH